jgi:hypothetical protein
MHNDTNNPHIHLIISSNEIESQKRVRLSKKQFSSIQANLEAYKNQTYSKELGLSERYGKTKDRSKQKQVEQEMKHKRKKIPKKEQIKQELSHIFEQAISQTALKNTLNSKGYELYTRGKTTGVIYEDKKYRLKTLGLENNYKKTLSNIQKREQRQQKRQDFKKSKTKSKSQNFDRSQSR